MPNGDQNEIPSEARVRVLASISLEHNIKWFRVGLELDSIAFCSISIAILKVEIFFDHHLALFPGIDHHLAPVRTEERGFLLSF